MNKLKKYIIDFFAQLEVYEDITNGYHFKEDMKQSILTFLDDETNENAFDVYSFFFDSYRIVLKDSSCYFIDLLDVLGKYEQNAAVLTDKQRDHYIHYK